MFKVLQYSLGYTFRKKSTPILLSIIFVLSLAVPLGVYLSGMQISYRYVKPEIFFNGIYASALIPIFMMIVSYVAIVVGQIFKRGEEDGTTLMLVSSKYTRSQVIIGRFAATVVHVLLLAIVFAVGFELASAFSSPAEAKYELLAFFSMLIGSFFICLLFAGLSLVFSIIMGRIGAIVTSVFMFVVLAVISPILLMMTSNASKGLDNFKTVAQGDYSSRKFYLYENKDTNQIETQEVMYSPTTSDYGQTSLTDYAKSTYNNLAWMDVWTQLSQMLGMLNKSDINPTELDKITPIDISNSYFYQKALPIIDGTVDKKTSEHPEAKMVFNLLKIFNNMINQDPYTSDLRSFSATELVKLQENFDKLYASVKLNTFSTNVKNYEDIIKALNKINFDYSSYSSNGLTGNLVALAHILGEDQNLLTDIKNHPTEYALHTSSQGTSITSSQGYSYIANPVTTTKLQKNGVDVNLESLTEYTNISKQQNEALNDVDAMAKRMAIYYAIYNVEKNNVSDAILQNTQQQYATQPIEEMIKHDQEFKNFFQFDGKNYSNGNTVALDQWANTFTSSPIVPSAFIYVFWPAVALGLFGLAFVLHRRADFK